MIETESRHAQTVCKRHVIPSTEVLNLTNKLKHSGLYLDNELGSHSWWHREQADKEEVGASNAPISNLVT